MAEQKKQEISTRGTKMAAEIRAKANKLTDEQRDQLMRVAMQLIYRKGNGGAVRSNCR